MVYIIKRRTPMPRTAKLFLNGRSQAVRLPAEFRFEGREVFIRQDEATGDVILSRRPESWDSFFKLRREANIPDEFMADRQDEVPQKRDLF
jgi:antitoxin VapB